MLSGSWEDVEDDPMGGDLDVVEGIRSTRLRLKRFFWGIVTGDVVRGAGAHTWLKITLYEKGHDMRDICGRAQLVRWGIDCMTWPPSLAIYGSGRSGSHITCRFK